MAAIWLLTTATSAMVMLLRRVFMVGLSFRVVVKVLRRFRGRLQVAEELEVHGLQPLDHQRLRCVVVVGEDRDDLVVGRAADLGGRAGAGDRERRARGGG